MSKDCIDLLESPTVNGQTEDEQSFDSSSASETDTDVADCDRYEIGDENFFM